MDFKRKRGRSMDRGDRPPRHPPHLRGKAIGLYYSNLNRQRDKNGENSERLPKAINQKPVSAFYSLGSYNLILKFYYIISHSRIR